MRRSGYTLLEILLALAIAVLLLGGLYVAVDMQINLAQSGRQRVEEGTVVRSLFARMDEDASYVLALPDTARFRAKQSSSSSGSGSSGSGASGGTTGSGSTGSTGSGSTGSGSTGSGSSSSTPITSLSTTGTISTYTNQNGVQVIVPPYGVIGDSQTLNMFISRVPREMINAQLQQQEGSVPIAGDLRRVSYWLIDGGGLAKQEVKLITADDGGAVNQSVLPPSNTDDASQYLFVEEVKSLQFEYFDGTNWNDTWDSTQLPTTGGDGVTPMGSPVAIRITVELAQPGRADPKKYQHVITFLTANGTTTLQQQSTNTTNPSTTGGGTTSP